MLFSLIKKKLTFWLLSFFLVCTVSTVAAQTDRIWDGSVSTEWGNNFNWTEAFPPNGDEVPDTPAENAIVNSVVSNRYPVINGANYTVYNVTLNAAGGSIRITTADTLRVNNILSVTNGDFINNEYLYVQGDVTISGSGTFSNNGTIYFDGSTNLSSNGWNFGDIIVTNGNSLTLLTPLTCNDLTLSGTLDTNGNNLTVNGSITINGSGFLDTSSGGNINVNNNWDNSGVFDPGSNTVQFTGSGDIGNADTFNNLTVSGGIRTCASGITVNNVLTVSGGSLECNTSGNIIAGTLTLSGGDMSVADPVTLQVSPGNFTVNNLSSLYSGSADVTITQGDLDVSSGSASFGGEVNLNGTDGDVSVSGGSVTFSSSASLNGTFGDCTISGSGSVTNMALFTITRDLYISNNGELDGIGAIVVGRNVSLADNTADFTGDGRDITVSGDWDETGSVFIAQTSTVIFDNNTPSLTAVSSFNNINVTGSVILNSDITVTNNLRISSGNLDVSANNRRINVGVNWNNTAGTVSFTERDGIVEFNGNGEIRNAEEFAGVNVSGGARTCSTGFSVRNNLEASGGSLTCLAGTVTTGSLSLTGGDMTVSNAATLTVETGNFTINNAGSAYTGNGSGNTALTDGNLDVDNGSAIFNHPVNFNGTNSDLDVSGGSVEFNSTVSFNGADGDIIVSGGTVDFNDTTSTTGTTGGCTISGSGDVINDGVLTISHDISMTGGSFTTTNNLSIISDCTFTGGTFSNTGMVYFDGTTNLTSNSQNFGNIRIRNGSTVTFLDPLTCNNNTVAGTLDTNGNNCTVFGSITINGSGILDTRTGGDILVQYNWDNSGTFYPGSNTVQFWGTGNIANAETFNNLLVSNGARSCSYNLIINNNLEIPGGTFTADGDLAINQNLQVNGGTLGGSGDIDVDGIVDLDNGSLNGSNRTIYVESGWEETAPVYITDTNSIVEVDGTIPGLLSVSPFNIFRVALSGDVTLGNAIDINGAFTIDGVFSTAGRQMNIAGDWSSAGTFNHGNNLVVFDGSTILDNSEVFYDVTIAIGQSLDINGNSLRVDGDFDISGIDEPYGELIRTGAGGETAPADSDSDSGKVIYRAGGGTVQAYAGTDYWTLEIQGTINLNDNIEINRDFIINGGTFNANDNIITISRNFDTDNANAFNHGESTVEFVNASITSQVRGSNTFYNFVCTTPGKNIFFDSGETQNIAQYGHFNIEGIEPPVIDGVLEHNQLVNLYSTYTLPLIDGGGGQFHPTDPYPGGFQSTEQWRIHISRSATASIDWVYVELSYSDYVILPENAIFEDPDWCHNWLFVVFVSDSWTMDNDGNGKIDRIGVEVGPGANLNDDFSDMDIEFTSERDELIYELKGENPFVTYSDNSREPLEQNDDMFFIKIVERDRLDTNLQPEWEITGNNSLKAQTGIERLVDTNGVQGTEDLAAPIIAYTLAVADKNEVFVCFSEPVVRNDGSLLGPGDFEYRGVEAVDIDPIKPIVQSKGLREVLVIFDNNITASEVYNEENIAVTIPTRDASGNGLLSYTHRVSDIGLGLIGNGLIEPAWAKDETGRDPVLGGIGFITKFDGTEWVRDQEIILQAHIHDDIDVNLDTQLFMDVNVNPSRVRRGLWLPGFDDTEYNGIVPKQNPQARAVDGVIITNPVNTNQLQNYTINPEGSEDPEIEDGALVEFVFKITDTDLYCARLADHYFTEDWYRKVRPWSFNIHDVLFLEEKVAIMNNVINPEYGEKVKLHYILEQSGKVRIYVFDLKGDIVDILYQGRKQNGDHSITWDGRNRGGRVVARGVYFIKVIAPKIEEVRKVLVVK